MADSTTLARPLALHWQQPGPRLFAAIKVSLFLVCLLPLAQLLWHALAGHAVNPIEDLTRGLGTWTLRLLLLTLCVSPLRALGAPGWLLRLRRMLGLYAFFYACLHLLTYLWLDQFFDWGAIVRDIVKRPFITVGMLAFGLLLPLAITSSDGWIRRLKRNWGKLHRLVYVIAPLGVLHYLWLVKRDIQSPLIYAAIVAVLLLWRVWRYLRPTLAARVK
ncbi:sulfite oxidase heme-binding subunit YedZ [Vogesella fluminis]|uniref:Protein-methionine-sulfoxide reductase heme-binding subunit MsrQ n=1 Tax=Vogesella fluminis TaxID=1069161 RepID=A0ABQ3H835_9NEIS|nr:protein-methionine-sulfoxide reductase heme-binding subunit MsrQ [Vogesella fluminis]GHD71246.1 protein-methionine-sulfoxide reductase heme-binding subunit MsrQ [Vogesella fluminis]